MAPSIKARKCNAAVTKISFCIGSSGAVARGAFEAGVIKCLVEEDVQIDRIVATSSGALNGMACWVIIAVPFPAVMETPDSLSGFDYLNHLIEVLINERLFRDLSSAQRTNDNTDRLQALVDKGDLNQAQMNQLTQLLAMRKVEVTEIRPEKRLKQSAFSGFFNEHDRVQLIDEGYRAARRMLERIPSHNPKGEQTT